MISRLIGCCTISVMLGACHGATAQPVGQSPRVEYTVTLDQPHTQMVGISMLVRGVRGEHIDFMLPIWRPGRYVVLNQAQSVRDVKAFGDGERPLKIEKTDKATWRVTLEGARSVRIDYRVYCNSLGDRMKHVDDTHAFLSGAAVFMYSPTCRNEGCAVNIVKPRDWKIACGLNQQDDPNSLAAASYDVLVDSPLEIGVHDVLRFDAAGKPHEIVIWGDAEYDAEQLTADFAKIVETEAAIFGSVPYERYVFIMHVGAGASGGTEHLNSTVMQTSRASLEDPDAYKRFLGLVSHEFFHTWNVKAFRPAGIHPYDYQRENYSKLLWVAEGTTSYYDDLCLVRAGFIKPNKYLETLSTAIDSMRTKPGEQVQSVEEASFESWNQFDRHTPDDINATVSFYTKGALVSLLLDLEMRRRSVAPLSERSVRSESGPTANLDQVMKVMYERFPLSGPGYTSDDLQSIIEELSGTEFDDIFARNVRAAEPLDFETALTAVGLELYFKPATPDDKREDAPSKGDEDPPTSEDANKLEDAEDAENTDASKKAADGESSPEADAIPSLKAYLGLNLRDESGRAIASAVLADGPAYAAGVLPGDEVLALNGRKLAARDLDGRLKKLEPGETVELLVFRRDALRRFEIALIGVPDGKWTIRRVKEPTDAQKAAYENWLGQAWPR